jgi:hypothetical protein
MALISILIFRPEGAFFSRAFAKTGKSIAASIAIIAIKTSSLTTVKPTSFEVLSGQPAVCRQKGKYCRPSRG